MKFNMICLVAFCLAAQSVFAQIPTVVPTEKLMSLGSRAALRVEFLHAKTGYVEDLWADFLKKEFAAKPKWDKKEKQSVAIDVKAPLLNADGAVDFYSKVEASGSDANFTVWIDLAADDFVSDKKPEAFKEAQSLVHRFAKAVKSQQIQDDLTAQTDKLRDFEKALKKQQREKDSLEKDIENWKKKIAKAEEDLKQNAKDQEKTQADIEAQTKAVQAVQTKLTETEKEN